MTLASSGRASGLQRPECGWRLRHWPLYPPKPQEGRSKLVLKTTELFLHTPPFKICLSQLNSAILALHKQPRHSLTSGNVLGEPFALVAAECISNCTLHSAAIQR